jgi:hypothetical protein
MVKYPLEQGAEPNVKISGVKSKNNFVLSAPNALFFKKGLKYNAMKFYFRIKNKKWQREL